MPFHLHTCSLTAFKLTAHRIRLLFLEGVGGQMHACVWGHLWWFVFIPETVKHPQAVHARSLVSFCCFVVFFKSHHSNILFINGWFFPRFWWFEMLHNFCTAIYNGRDSKCKQDYARWKELPIFLFFFFTLFTAQMWVWNVAHVIVRTTLALSKSICPFFSYSILIRH